MAIQVYLDSNMKTAIAPANTTFTQYTTQEIELFTLKEDADTIGFNVVRPDGKNLPMVDMTTAGTELVGGVLYNKYTGQLGSYATAIMPGLGDTGTALLSFTSFILDEEDNVTQRMSSPVIRLNVQRSLEPNEEPERTDRYTPLAARVTTLETSTLEIAQELDFPTPLFATENITKGDVVMFAGANGDQIIISKATSAAVNQNARVIIGVAGQNIPANVGADYEVVWFGEIASLNTSAYGPAGTVLYFNHAVAGGLTSTKPTAPNKAITIAVVKRQQQSSGRIIVRPLLIDENIFG
jgi:hypothetical protein